MSETNARRAPLRVILVTNRVDDHGGGERALYELIQRTSGRVSFTVVSARLAEELRPLVEWERFRIPQRPAPLRALSLALVGGLHLARARRHNRQAIVHSLGAIVPNRVDLATVQLCHTGFVAEHHRLAPPGVPLARRLNIGVARIISLLSERWCYRPARARMLAPVSVGTQKEVTRHFPGVPSLVTPNGVDLDRFRPNADYRKALRAELGVPADTFVAIFVGGSWDWKGLAEVIKGIGMLRHTIAVPVELWVVGSGDIDRFRRLAQSYHIGDAVRFLGFQPATEQYYSASDVFVLPTLYETFSLAAYEAAATGLPIVATRVNGIDELLDDGTAGIAVEREHGAIADALARLATDAELRARMGNEARRRAFGYDWDRSVESVCKAYEMLAQEQLEAQSNPRKGLR